MDSSFIDKVPSSPLPTILNFRDLGQTVNILSGYPLFREGLIYRSARPDDASSTDRSRLTSVYNIKNVIDLRSTTEHIDQAKKRTVDGNLRASVIVSKNDQKAVTAVKIPGINYHEVNLNGGAFARALLWKLRWSSLAKLMALMALGYRTEAIAILGREVMAPRGLVGLGKDTLDHGSSELLRIFSVLADSANYPVLIHCTQGKDRTGLVVMLLLLLLGVSQSVVSADYRASTRELQVELEARIKEIRAVGLGEEFAGCPENFVDEMVRHINDSYGGLGEYLKKIGVDMEMQTRILKNLKKNESDTQNESSH